MAESLPADRLTKLYIEPTTACNLDCMMCVRNFWHECRGVMPIERFSALMDQVRAFDPPPRIRRASTGAAATATRRLSLPSSPCTTTWRPTRQTPLKPR